MWPPLYTLLLLILFLVIVYVDDIYQACTGQPWTQATESIHWLLTFK